jgi:hypothetical protein
LARIKHRGPLHEVGYGSLWREFAPVPTYRVEWVRATGELYAVELSESDEARDPVEVLGVLWSRPQVEACLAGWSERCGEPRVDRPEPLESAGPVGQPAGRSKLTTTTGD